MAAGHLQFQILYLKRAWSRLGSLSLIWADMVVVASFNLGSFKIPAKTDYFPASENTRRALIKWPLDIPKFLILFPEMAWIKPSTFLLIRAFSARVASLGLLSLKTPAKIEYFPPSKNSCRS